MTLGDACFASVQFSSVQFVSEREDQEHASLETYILMILLPHQLEKLQYDIHRQLRHAQRLDLDRITAILRAPRRRRALDPAPEEMLAVAEDDRGVVDGVNLYAEETKR